MSGYARFAQYYDVLTQNVGYAKRAEYFDSIIKQNLQDAGLLLDLACGTGSLSMEMAARGYDVIGVDASQEMLSVALQKAVQSEKDILFLCQPMQRLDLYGTVDACVCALDSLNHLPDEAALEQVLARLKLFVRPGGIFLFDVNTAYKHSHVLGNHIFVYDLPQVYCVWQNSYHREHHRVDIALDFFVPGANGAEYRRFSERFSERVFSHDVILRQLERAGFTCAACYGDDTLLEPGPETQRLVYVAKREE